MNIKRYLFGYYKITVNEDDLARLLSLLVKLNISAQAVGNVIYLSAQGFNSFSRFSKDIEYSHSPLLGLPGMAMRIYKSPGIIIGSVISLLLFLLLYIPIWDVRAQSTIKLTEEQILDIAKECGLYVGRPWRLVNADEIEAQMLKSCDEISWVNINRRGSVAYLTVIENDSKDKSDSVGFVGSIVADRDTVIEEIDVKSGIPLVKPGDVVYKGDVLIIGVYETENGTAFPGAEGTVKGSVSERVRVFVPRLETTKTLTKKVTLEKKIKIFNFTLNILKNYRNQPDECDIITTETPVCLFGGIRLPISYIESVAHIVRVEEALLDDSELVSQATLKVEDELMALTRDKDLIKLSTNVNIDENGYEAILDIVYLTEVGAEMPLEIDSEGLWQKN